MRDFTGLLKIAGLEKTANWLSKAIVNMGKRRGSPFTANEIAKFLRRNGSRFRRMDFGSGKMSIAKAYNEAKRGFSNGRWFVRDFDFLPEYLKKSVIMAKARELQDLSSIPAMGARSKYRHTVERPMQLFEEGRNFGRVLGNTTKEDFRFVPLKQFARENGTQFIFKGNSSVPGSDFIARSANPGAGEPGMQWWTSNPYVAAGYSTQDPTTWARGQISIMPARGRVRRLVHNFSTPHTSLSDRSEIVKANRAAKKGTLSGQFRDMDTAASRAADYEVTMTPEEWMRNRSKAKTVFGNFDLTRYGEGDFPVMHGLNDFSDVGRYDGFIVPSDRAQKLLRKYNLSGPQLEVLRRKRFLRAREIKDFVDSGQLNPL